MCVNEGEEDLVMAHRLFVKQNISMPNYSRCSYPYSFLGRRTVLFTLFNNFFTLSLSTHYFLKPVSKPKTNKPKVFQQGNSLYCRIKILRETKHILIILSRLKKFDQKLYASKCHGGATKGKRRKIILHTY